MRVELNQVTDVVARQLCCGCGVCSYVAPDRYAMVDLTTFGRRPAPVPKNGHLAAEFERQERDAMAVCPGRRLEHDFDEEDPELITSLRPNWGPVYEVWEGHASDPDIRRGASSGGALTALALYALERGGMHGVLHTAARRDKPWLNETVMSRTRDELRAQVGSRYAPASPCDGLARIEQADGPCVFVGKPCDVAGARAAAKIRPALESKLGLTIAFFCAGAPSTQGTLDLLQKVGVDDPERVRSVRYRGNGWPGRWTARYVDDDGAERESSLSYEESWDFLQRYRQWRCYICPDHTGEFADIAVGDPWYRAIEPDEPGSSLILARTPRGRRFIKDAADAGYLTLVRNDPELLPKSQRNLARTRGRLWGQMIALAAARVPRPRYIGFPMRAAWRDALSISDRLKAIPSTFKRIRRRGLRRTVELDRSNAT